MKKLKNFIKIKYIKFLIFFRKKLNYTVSLTEDEKQMKSLVLKVINDPTIKYHISPNTNRVIISLKNNDITVDISTNRVIFANHKYFHEEIIRNDFGLHLFNILYSKLERDIDKLEKTIYLSKKNVRLEILKNLSYED